MSIAHISNANIEHYSFINYYNELCIADDLFYRFLRFHRCDLLAIMSNLFVELTAPNQVKYIQPTGLFINNEFVKSLSGEKILSIDPA